MCFQLTKAQKRKCFKYSTLTLRNLKQTPFEKTIIKPLGWQFLVLFIYFIDFTSFASFQNNHIFVSGLVKFYFCKVHNNVIDITQFFQSSLTMFSWHEFYSYWFNNPINFYILSKPFVTPYNYNNYLDFSMDNGLRKM